MAKVDLLITNANVLTLDNENHQASSLAVSNGKISGIWADPEPPSNEVDTTTATQVLNLKGKTLIPGFIETHNHILGYSLFRQMVDCSYPLNQTIDDILQNVRERGEQTPKGEWIFGQGYDDTLLAEKRHPTRDELDQVTSRHPVMIQHTSAHLAVANSMALKLAGLDETISDPPGGHYGRYDDGRLNGVIYEMAAMQPLTAVRPTPSADELLEALKQGAQDYIEQGITTNTDATVGLLGNGKDLEVHLQAAAEKKKSDACSTYDHAGRFLE